MALHDLSVAFKHWLLAGAAVPLHSTSMSSAANSGASIVYVTVPDNDTAKKLSHGLVEGKLAACVNIIPGNIYNYRDRLRHCHVSCPSVGFSGPKPWLQQCSSFIVQLGCLAHNGLITIESIF